MATATPSDRDLSDFRTAFYEAIDKAQAAREIGFARAIMLRSVARNPRRLANVYAYVCDECDCAGLGASLTAGTHGAPDWAALLAFLQGLLPIIAQLIGLFKL